MSFFCFFVVVDKTVLIFFFGFFKALPVAPTIQKVEFAGTRRRAQDMEWDLWREADLKPVFTFLLRPRLIQTGIGVKLLCCLSGKPTPKVSWFKGGVEIDQRNPHYLISYNCGVCTLEIPSCLHDDCGSYTCKAENPLGMDQTSCVLSVEGKIINLDSIKGLPINFIFFFRM